MSNTKSCYLLNKLLNMITLKCKQELEFDVFQSHKGLVAIHLFLCDYLSIQVGYPEVDSITKYIYFYLSIFFFWKLLL